MAGVFATERTLTGFSFENCKRNARLIDTGFNPPKATKTGTTIVGIVFKDGVILGADTRATSDTTVADKNCEKIHYLADNIYCCGAGTAADTVMTTLTISSQLELHRLNTGRTVRVCTAKQLLKQLLFRYQGHIGAALVLGGVDTTGPHLHSIHPHGSTDSLPFTTMGSGSLAAMAVLETQWKPDLSEEEGKVVVRNAIAAGIFNDLASGSNVDLCIIRRGSAEKIRPYDIASQKGQRQGNYRFRHGTTGVLATRIIPLVTESEEVRRTEVESMDTSS